jgi:tetratricopeptide (TPR) repeat protein
MNIYGMNRDGQPMIEINASAGNFSWIAKGREFLENGDLQSALECYDQAYDPESLDEYEARNMLIEARAHLSRKHILEALESFEEALSMGTDVQRKQALDGISTVGEIKSQLGPLTAKLKKSLKGALGKRGPHARRLALVSDTDNVVLVSPEAADSLPAHLLKGGKIGRLPQHLSDFSLPFATDRCIPYTDEDDVRYILDVAAALSGKAEVRPNQ